MFDVRCLMSIRGLNGRSAIFSVCCFGSASASEPKKTERMMFGRAGLSWLANDLVHEPAPAMAAIAHSSRNSAQPGFKRNTQRIREKDRHVKRHLLLPQLNN